MTGPGAATDVLPIVFVHIPKCAGRSVEAMLRAQYPGVVEYEFTVANSGEFEQLPQAARDRCGLLLGHNDFGVQELLSRRATCLTMVREPVDRIISRYYYLLQENQHPLAKRRAPIADCLRAWPDNEQVRYLCSSPRRGIPRNRCTQEHLAEAKHNLEQGFAAFGLVEHFPESMELFDRALGWAGVRMEHENRTFSRIGRDAVDPQTEAAIVACNGLDIELYEFARELFARRLREHRAQPAEGR